MTRSVTGGIPTRSVGTSKKWWLIYRYRRAIDYYLKASAPDAPNFVLNDNLSFEDALAHAADLLHCAVETVNVSGETLSTQQRAVMHLVGMAKGVVDRALECVQPR